MSIVVTNSRGLSVCVVVIALAGCTCGSPDLLPHADGSASDAATDAVAAPLDGGAPPQYCPDDIAQRRVAVSSPDGLSLLRLHSGSTNDHDVVAVTLRARTGSESRATLWATERGSTRARELGSWVGREVKALSTSADGATVLLETVAEPALERIRWHEGGGTETSNASVAAGTSPILERSSTGDSILMVNATEEGRIHVEHWDWPEAEAPRIRPADTTLLDDFVASGGHVSLHGLHMPDLGIAVAAMVGGSGQLFWLDIDSRRIVMAMPFTGEALAPSDALVPLGESAVGLIVESEGATAVWRADLEGLTPWARLPDGFRSGAATGNAEGAYLTVGSRQATSLGVPGERVHDAPQYLARVRADAPLTEGGFRPLFTGTCPIQDLSPGLDGGLILASMCHPAEIEFTYFCVPGL